MTQLMNKKQVMEGDNVDVYCNATGIPDPTVIWRKVQVQGDGYNPTEGNLLTITTITRAQAGEYRCTVNNTCGVASTVMNINVQCKNIKMLLNLAGDVWVHINWDMVNGITLEWNSKDFGM